MNFELVLICLLLFETFVLIYWIFLYHMIKSEKIRLSKEIKVLLEENKKLTEENQKLKQPSGEFKALLTDLFSSDALIRVSRADSEGQVFLRQQLRLQP